jgi:hypothetical protein
VRAKPNTWLGTPAPASLHATVARLPQRHNTTPLSRRYARDWILANVDLCKSEEDALQLAQGMLNLGIFHEIYDRIDFATKRLFFFTDKGRGTLPLLRQRIVATEDQMLSQIKTNKQAFAEAQARLLKLDWRISVSEQRVSAAEHALRRALAAQQLLMAAVLVAVGARYVPAPVLLAEAALAVASVLLLVALLESRLVLQAFMNLRVRSLVPVAICTATYESCTAMLSRRLQLKPAVTCEIRVSHYAAQVASDASLCPLQIDYHGIARAMMGHAELTHAEPLNAMPTHGSFTGASSSRKCALLSFF